jgi:hypothetical protein
MPSKSVDRAFTDFLATELDTPVYLEYVPRGSKPEYIVVQQSGYEFPEAPPLGMEAGLASMDCTIYARTQDKADPIRRALKRAARRYRGVQGDYHITATRLTGDTPGGLDEATGVYTYVVAVEIEYTE